MKKWSVFVYICADEPDPRLQRAAIEDVSEMRKVGSNDRVSVVAQIDLPVLPTKRYVFPPNAGSEPSATISVIELDRNINSADPASIVEFFEWANKVAPAENIFFIMWGHGFGIDDFNPFLVNAAPPGTMGRPEEPGGFPDSNSDGYAGFPDSNFVPLPVSGSRIRDFTVAIPDAGQRAFLQNSQIGDAIKECRNSLSSGQNLAILGFDACEMSLLEVWFDMAGAADLGIASQFGIPFSGWPYAGMLQQLLEHPDLTPEQLAKNIVREFADFNNGQESKPVVTLSACNLGRADDVGKPVAALAKALAEVSGSREGREKIFDARNRSPIFDEDGFVDVEGFCRLLQVSFPNSEIDTLSSAVIQAVRTYVLAHDFAPNPTTKKISRSTGVSLWFPPWIQYPDVEILEKEESEEYFRTRYSSTKFAEATGWDRFLKRIFTSTRQDSEDKAQEEEVVMPTEDDLKGSAVLGHQGDGQGKQGPGQGKQGPGQGKQSLPARRNNPVSEGEPDARVFLGSPSQGAGVIVRATVESFGPIGETELNVTVKWPAGGNSSPVVEPVKRQTRPPGVSSNVD